MFVQHFHNSPSLNCKSELSGLCADILGALRADPHRSPTRSSGSRSRKKIINTWTWCWNADAWTRSSAGTWQQGTQYLMSLGLGSGWASVGSVPLHGDEGRPVRLSVRRTHSSRPSRQIAFIYPDCWSFCRAFA